MTDLNQRDRSKRRAGSAARVASRQRAIRPPTLDEIIAARPFPPLTVQQLRERWMGVFEPEFWEEVRRAARSGKPEPPSR